MKRSLIMIDISTSSHSSYSRRKTKICTTLDLQISVFHVLPWLFAWSCSANLACHRDIVFTISIERKWMDKLCWFGEDAVSTVMDTQSEWEMFFRLLSCTLYLINSIFLKWGRGTISIVRLMHWWIIIYHVWVLFCPFKICSKAMHEAHRQVKEVFVFCFGCLLLLKIHFKVDGQTIFPYIIWKKRTLHSGHFMC